MSVYPLVSIITPSLNQGSYIKQTIQSVFDQDYPNIEYIVMDGGSRDETISILRNAEKMSHKNNKGVRFYWESKKDTGQADAINRGLRRAKGEIVAYLNSDDYYLPGAVSTIMSYFYNHKNVAWVSGDYKIVDKNGKEIHKMIQNYKNVLRFLKITLKFTNSIVQPSTFWRRSLLTSIGFFDIRLRYTFDYDYWLRVSAKFSPIIIDKRLSAFRIHPQSKGGSMYVRQFMEEQEVLERYTRNPIMIKLHGIHAKLITYVYDQIK